ncbi:hypothetical protein TTHERM_01015910 (macronuclear) [Tetrahymena thermophila SB210]|uniref:MRH domain-containing protein n=1 Tax=Tetrahymena thermophila (strain SB210) TaxID=312017 RepID=Q22CV0_TETTS|nr:hypothetical protein TTHERM_01015910 [Tetrahymena thermophila SB210]EAR83088.2 hypothetical protein TTHERM_01015910 [Tetrahymena thermophila SB210]|eukprot:XP_001030751.2 hypothetical protein TTHERM_01015910 [Tetrahymena thermophila SB210]
MKEKTHPLHYKSEFYDFTSRTFRLSNGNRVQCQIPIFSTMNQNFLPTLEEEFQNSQTNATISISQQSSKPISEEEGDKILQSLQNQCAEYRTSQFLWQFCYKKYLRQFDDISTIQEAQKQAFEDIYAGYHTFYNNITNLTTQDYNKTWNSQNYFEIDNHQYEKKFKYVNKTYINFPHIPASNISDDFFVKIQGHVIQLNGINTSQISNSHKWSISFNTTSEIPQNKLSSSLFKNKNELASNGNKYYYQYEYLLHFFVDKNFALAETEFPSDIQISSFIIRRLQDNKLQTNLELLRIFNGQYIYGKKLNALKHFSSNDLIIVHLYNQVFIKKIKKVWYHNLIELYEDSQGKNLKSNDFFIQSIQIFNRFKIYEIQKTGNIDHLFKGHSDVYFEFTNFPKKERFISGRFLLNYQYLNAKIGDNLMFISKNSYQVIKIKNIIAGIIELDQSLDYFNGFIIKANSIKSKQTYFDYFPSNKNIKTQSILLDQSKNYLPKTPPINCKKKQFPLTLSFKSIQDEISSDSQFLPFTDLEGFSFSESDLKYQRFFSFFIPKLLIREDFSQFKLLITDSLEQINEGVEVVLSNENLILAYDVFNKKNIVSKNKRYENSTLYDTTVWILLDTDNTLRLGFSQVISPSSQVLQLQTNYTNLRHFRILTKHTVNYNIKYPYLDIISRPIDFSVLNPDIMQYRGQSISQNYYNGEFCSVINGPRRFQAKFVCGESFFSIQSVTEPSTCVYKVIAETYLLCENHVQTYNIPPPPKNIYCILK